MTQWLTVIGLCLAAQASGTNPPAPRDDAKKPASEGSAGKSKLRELIDRSIAWYPVSRSTDDAKPMQAVTVLRWANNVRGSEEGLTVLWINKGRPEAAVAIYPWYGNLCHSFVTCSRGTVVASRDGKVVWRPQKGVEFRTVPEALVPADSAAARLRQMKAIAGEFQATLLGWKADNSDREELRLLARPLYRYESEDARLLDGAVFAFTQGTDPEAFLLLEAIRVGEGFEWQFGFARDTSGAVEARHRDKTVWTVSKLEGHGHPQGDLIIFEDRMEP